jgi:hypothetical protein
MHRRIPDIVTEYGNSKPASTKCLDHMFLPKPWYTYHDEPEHSTPHPRLILGHRHNASDLDYHPSGYQQLQCSLPGVAENQQQCLTTFYHIIHFRAGNA